MVRARRGRGGFLGVTPSVDGNESNKSLD